MKPTLASLAASLATRPQTEKAANICKAIMRGETRQRKLWHNLCEELIAIAGRK